MIKELSPAENDLIESIRNYRKTYPDSRVKMERYILGLVYDLLEND